MVPAGLNVWPKLSFDHLVSMFDFARVFASRHVDLIQFAGDCKHIMGVCKDSDRECSFHGHSCPSGVPSLGLSTVRIKCFQVQNRPYRSQKIVRPCGANLLHLLQLNFSSHINSKMFCGVRGCIVCCLSGSGTTAVCLHVNLPPLRGRLHLWPTGGRFLLRAAEPWSLQRSLRARASIHKNSSAGMTETYKNKA